MTVTPGLTQNKPTLPWVEKYRPKSLDDVLGHRDVLNTLKGFIATGSLPHILLHGPPGTGKTTIVKALAHAVYGKNANSMVLELNASDDRGIATVREVIKEFASFQPTATTIDPQAEFKDSPMASLKLIVLDEADQMTSAAQMALRRIIELHSGTVRFFVICNYMNKINAALQSRCTKFRMPPLKVDAVRDRIKEVAEGENIPVSDKGIDMLLKISNGDMRNIMNLMEASSMMGVGLDHVNDALGFPSDEAIEEMKMIMLERDFTCGYNAIMHLKKTKGYRLNDILEGIYNATVADDWPLSFAAILIPRIGTIQCALNDGADEDLQAAALVAAFIEARYALYKSGQHANTPAKPV